MSSTINLKRTKIVATIGPASSNEETLREMIRAGMNVARINFSHGDHEQHAQMIALIRRVAEEEQTPVAIMGDLQGPKIRLGDLEPEPIEITIGDQLVLTSRPTPDQTQRHLPLPHSDFIRDIRVGNRLLIDDGEIELVVRNQTSEDLTCEVVIGDELKSRKGISAPDASLNSISSLTEKDRQDAIFALEQELDFLAMSFVRNGDDMRELRWLMRHHNGDVWLIAKVEKIEALENLAEILKHSDAIMVARGDLGVEIPAAEVPIHQKRIIDQCNLAGKPVITATQMLNSMIQSPRPTRAEASDVANAIFDGTDAVMLSGETASGKYPVESVQTMSAIAAMAETHMIAHSVETKGMTISSGGSDIIADAISHATTEMADAVGARLIVTSTWTGYTPRRIARERPMTPILCVTPNQKTYHRMMLVWGVLPLEIEEFHTIDEMLERVVKVAKSHDLVDVDDILVIIAGVPFGGGGHTNFLKLHRVGENGELH